MFNLNYITCVFVMSSPGGGVQRQSRASAQLTHLEILPCTWLSNGIRAAKFFESLKDRNLKIYFEVRSTLVNIFLNVFRKVFNEVLTVSCFCLPPTHPCMVFIISLRNKRGKTGPTMQLFAGFTDNKPVVIGLSENINRFMCEYKPSRLVYFNI